MDFDTRYYAHYYYIARITGGIAMTELERILRNEREHLRVELEDVRALISTSEQRLTKIIERLRHVDGLLGDVEADLEPASHDPPLQETASIRFNGESITDLAEKVLLQHRASRCTTRIWPRKCSVWAAKSRQRAGGDSCRTTSTG